jgi:hypothetical protein
MRVSRKIKINDMTGHLSRRSLVSSVGAIAAISAAAPIARAAEVTSSRTLPTERPFLALVSRHLQWTSAIDESKLRASRFRSDSLDGSERRAR